MVPSLDGVNGKLSRAKDHLEHLKRVLSERSDAEAVQTVTVNEQTKRWTYEVAIKQPPEVPLLARLLIGDIVHALAAALDHLVFQLSLSHQLRTGNLRALEVCEAYKTHFPIFPSTKDGAESRINKRLSLMAQAPADLIRGMQPYQRTADDPSLNVAEDPLWILFKLDVIDKHRVVLTTNEVVAAHSVTITSRGVEPQVINVPEDAIKWQPFKDSTQLLHLSFNPGEVLKPDVKLNLACTLSVQFAETGLWCDGKPVVALLTLLIRYIEIAVIGELAPHVG